MENRLFTIKKESSFTIKEKKSVFIGQSYKCLSENDVKNHINIITNKYDDATHNCWAYRIGIKQFKLKYNDDGEPSGTAGKPILNIIQKNDLTNILINVTRYYGGIKLGAGGLIRAYSKSAQKVVEKSIIKRLEKYLRYSIIIDYSNYDQIENFFKNNSIKLESKEFKKFIEIKILVPKKKEKLFLNFYKNLTKNKYKAKFLNTFFV